jgi:hypothetical protein
LNLSFLVAKCIVPWASPKEKPQSREGRREELQGEINNIRLNKAGLRPGSPYDGKTIMRSGLE